MPSYRPVPEGDESTVCRRIYVWPDGSDALVMLNLNAEEVTLVMRWSGTYTHPQLGECEPCFQLLTHTGVRSALWDDSLDTPFFPVRLEAMLCNLFLNLGVQADLVDLGVQTYWILGLNQTILPGAFVLPSPEEVEVMNILDEPLPFWWSFADLLQWVRSRP